MRLPTLTTAIALATSGLAMGVPAAPAAAQQWRDITCESWNYREEACPVPNAQRVQLLRVRGGDCIEGQTWLHDGRTIRVRNGCRAVFRVDSSNGWGTGGWDPGFNGGIGGGNFGQPVQRLRCESWNFRDQRCPVNGVIRSARISRVIAGDCRDGATWRWTRNAITVRNGCRADFEVISGANGWNPGNQGGNWPGGGNQGGFPGGGIGGGAGNGRPIATINCQSFNYRAERCAIPRARAVQISRVLGGDCQQGRTWSWSAGQISVNGGCRAAFDIY